MPQTNLRQTTELPDLLPLASVPDYVEGRKEVRAREQRRETAERRLAIAKAQVRGQSSTTPVEDQVEKLLAGGRVSALFPPNEVAAATTEIEILTQGIFAAKARLEEIRGELSFAVCARFRKEHDANMRAAFSAATELFNALERNRVLRGRIEGAGYQLLDGAMPIHIFPAATLLGDPKVSNYPAGQFGTWLEERGII